MNSEAKDLRVATWYQIHTNGGFTTFARIYEGYDAEGLGCWHFEKMSVDSTTPHGGAELFGMESYTSDLSARERLAAAINTGGA